VRYQFRISGNHHQAIYKHLFPGDGKEAVAIVLCGRYTSINVTILLVKELYPIQYSDCDRSGDFVAWKTETIIHLLERANKENLSVIKIHSHPGGFREFSELDNESDLKLLPSVYGWMDKNQPHASAVMLPDGEIFGRIVDMDGCFHNIDRLALAGDEIKIWPTQFIDSESDDLLLRNRQTLGAGTIGLLKKMKIGVVGASGTGSPTIEQLVRLGVGELVLIDPDIIEIKNLNRILNSTLKDAENERLKVDTIKSFIEQIGFETLVTTHPINLFDSRQAIYDLITCDVLFGCVDSIDGRHLLNQIASLYLIPYFDLGVKIEADGLGGISQVNGVVHYVQPCGSSLLSRGAYTIKGLEAASLKRKSPDEYLRRKQEKYIVNLPVESPAVLSINMQVSSVAMTEFLDRINRFKNSEPRERSVTWIAITEGINFYESDGEADAYLARRAGRGDTVPFLEMSDL
jgi:proteasome lid subunit RPN8/RPN11